MKTLLILFAVLSLNFVYAFSLKEKVLSGHAGDFVVTSHSNTYTVLLIRSISEKNLFLEEISASEETLKEMRKSNEFSWRSWVEKGAPGHTSWTAYEVDLSTNKLVECYSYSQKGWLYVDDPNQFLPKLLSLSLNRVPENARKRIGPPPSEGEADHRSLWNPPVTQDGKTQQRSNLIPWSGKWPYDSSIISGCQVELYFGNAPFPYWIDIKSPHYTASIRSVDSGSALNSPMPQMPQRLPEFLGKAVWNNNIINISLKCPPYYAKLNLYVLDLTDHTAPIPLAAEMQREGDKVTLQVREEILEPILQKGHKYQWIIVPEESTQVAESADIFIW
jgi:hypothetical protein